MEEGGLKQSNNISRARAGSPPVKQINRFLSFVFYACMSNNNAFICFGLSHEFERERERENFGTWDYAVYTAQRHIYI